MENQLAMSGHLYDVFRKRLENFGKELVTDENYQMKLPSAKTTSEVNAGQINKIAEAATGDKNTEEAKVATENKSKSDDSNLHNINDKPNADKDEANEKEVIINSNDIDSENLNLYDEVNIPSNAEKEQESNAVIDTAEKTIENFKSSILPNANEEVKEIEAGNELAAELLNQFRESFDDRKNEYLEMEDFLKNKDEFEQFISNNKNMEMGGSNQVVKEIMDQFEEDLTNKTSDYLNADKHPIRHENIEQFKDYIANKTNTDVDLKSKEASSPHKASSSDAMNEAKISNSDVLNESVLENLKDLTSGEPNANVKIETTSNNFGNEMLALYKDYIDEKKYKNKNEEIKANALADEILNKYKNSPAYKVNKVIESQSKKIVNEIIDKFENYKKHKGLPDLGDAIVDDEINVVPKSISGVYEMFKKSYANIGDNEYNIIRSNLDKLADALEHNLKLKTKPSGSGNILQDDTIARRYLKNYIANALEANKKRRHGNNFLFSQNTMPSPGLSRKLWVQRRQIPNKVTSVYGDQEAYPFSGTSVDSSFPGAFPGVLTRESYLGALTSGNMLSTIAKEMNMTNLEVAQKLTTLGDLNPENLKNEPKLSKVLQTHFGESINLIKNAEELATANSSSIQTVEKHKNKVEEPECEDETEKIPVQKAEEPEKTKSQPIEKSQTAQSNQKATSLTALPDKDINEEKSCEESGNEIPPSVMAVLDKVLENLERLQNDKSNDDDEDMECPAEGTPCNLAGLWNSHALGIAFEINIIKHATGNKRTLSPTEKGNLLLSIKPKECDPPKHHFKIIDLKWSFMGSTLKEMGGPFYMYTQPHSGSGNKLATFVGYCRVCGGIDTIFGSWAFASPSTDCQNIVSSFENKADVMRRNNMEAKRVERYKNLLYAQKFPNKV